MAKNFAILRAKMTPAARLQADEQARLLLAEMVDTALPGAEMPVEVPTTDTRTDEREASDTAATLDGLQKLS